MTSVYSKDGKQKSFNQQPKWKNLEWIKENLRGHLRNTTITSEYLLLLSASFLSSEWEKNAQKKNVY